MISEVEIIYKTRFSLKDAPIIKSSEVAANLLREHCFNTDTIEHREEMNLMLMNKSSKVIGFKLLSIGAIDKTICDLRIIFQAVLLTNATAIIISHNHPSGNLKPSESDIRLTEQLKKACAIMEITLFDHIILTAEGYYSFADEGQI